MKLRLGFISNSSSSSFLITNKSNKSKTMKDFVKQISFVYDSFVEAFPEYLKDKQKHKCYSKEEMLRTANQCIPMSWGPGKTHEVEFSTEDGSMNLVGFIIGLMLKENGETEDFKWKYLGWNG